MKVFISWSGPDSESAALVLRDWLPDLLQSVEPWVSSADIIKGSPWLQGITDELQAVRFGILCITPSNSASPWMNFEAGAMSVAKGVGRQHVAPLLFGLKQAQLSGPLTQFQTTEFNASDVLKLAQSLNSATQTNRLPAERLIKQFERLWPDLEQRMDEVLRSVAAAKPPRPPEDMIEEALITVRALGKQQVELYKLLLGRQESVASRERTPKAAENKPPDLG